MHISSNHTEQLERELKQLKEEHQNLTVDYEQLKSNHQNLTDGHMKLEENYDQFKNLIYAYMGGCFKCLVVASIVIIENKKSFIPCRFYFV